MYMIYKSRKQQHKIFYAKFILRKEKKEKEREKILDTINTNIT